MSSGLSNAFKQSLRRPGFLLVFLVLLVGAVGINAATSALNLFFRKEALPLRSKEGLNALPLKMGRWVCIPEPHTVNADMEHSLQTDKYVFRNYVNLDAQTEGGAPIATQAEIKAMGDMKEEELQSKLSELRRKNTNAVLNLAITYYTGKVDTVPHVPERCLGAEGFSQLNFAVKSWQLGEYSPGAPRKVDVRFIDFEDQTGRSHQNRCVTYFFHANGKYEESPDVVRLRLQNLFEKYGYFAKIEVMTLLPARGASGEVDALREADRNKAADAVETFLTAALPEVEKLLPDPVIFNRR